MGRPRKYTPGRLRKAVERYFRSISRTVALTEPVPTGEKDEDGHAIYRQEPVRNDLGEQVEVVRYILPPTMADLCQALRIHPATWSRWEDAEKYPEYAQIVQEVRARLLAWNQRELLTREGKDVRGIIFNLQANFGLREKSEVELGPKAAGVLLKMDGETERYAE